MLGLGYPGGPLVERLSKKGNPKKIRFNCSDTRNPLDFSFSGIKTAVLYYLKKQKTEGRRQKAEEEIADVAAAFQEAVIDTLIRKSLLACEKEKVKRLVIGGGVAVNQRLRQSLVQAAKLRAVECFFPVQEFCLDNAAMVAGLGYQLYRRGHKSDLYLSPDLN
jgi:N6-L-threonylcarbamoyladenine synthase